MHAGGTCGADPALVDADATVDVVHQQTGHAREQQRRDQEPDEQPQERQREHVEREVQVELGIGLAEGLLVEEQQDGLPLRGHRGGREEAEDHGHRDHHDLAHRVQGLLVLAHGVRDLTAPGPVTVREPQAEEHETRHDQGGDHEQADGGEVLGDEHLQVPELLEPQHVGVDLGGGHEQRDEDHHRDHGGQQRPALGAARCGPLGRAGRRGSGGHCLPLNSLGADDHLRMITVNLMVS